MAIPLAFSTVACPDWTLEQVLHRAREYGYAGVELRTLGAGSTQIASDPALSEPAKVAKAFEQSGISPVCLSTSESLHHRGTSAGHQASWRIREAVDLAGRIGAPMVRVFGYEVAPGENRRSVLGRIAERVTPLADYAGDQGVRLVFENAGSFAAAKDWWTLFNLVEHPMLKLCWNVANAAAAGEGPAVSVPMLHSRIAIAKVKDTLIGEGAGYVPLGEGSCQIEQFVRRLMGIGYQGWITVEWDRLWLPSLTPAEEYLPDAAKRLQGWMDAIAQAVEEGRVSQAKTAAKNAPKPRPQLK
ncbi:MAG: sugar phosphate isomerase/epimerase [Phycisphaeraceae bacterium]|nr:sugar phosphate isomerase/epimerase [Phycisphaeraceae bacterium]